MKGRFHRGLLDTIGNLRWREIGAVEFVERIILGVWQSRDIFNFEAQSFRSLEPGARASGQTPIGRDRRDLHERALSLQETGDREAGLIRHGVPKCLSPD